jgi:hypothetical protein
MLQLDGSASVSAPFDAATMKSFPLEDSPTLLSLEPEPLAPRAVLINTRSTIQQTFFGYIDRLEFTNLLNSYNSFNSNTRAAANTLAATYNQGARRDVMFAAMDAMASVAQNQNQSLCRSKTTATVNAITDFLANVGSEPQ